jgi:hypothetical protein
MKNIQGRRINETARGKCRKARKKCKRTEGQSSGFLLSAYLLGHKSLIKVMLTSHFRWFKERHIYVPFNNMTLSL